MFKFKGANIFLRLTRLMELSFRYFLSSAQGEEKVYQKQIELTPHYSGNISSCLKSVGDNKKERFIAKL